MLNGFMGTVDVNAAIISIVIIIVMVQDVFSMLCHMLGNKRQTLSTAAAQYVRKIALRRCNRLQRKDQHQQYQEGIFHFRAIIAAADYSTPHQARKALTMGELRNDRIISWIIYRTPKYSERKNHPDSVLPQKKSLRQIDAGL